MIKIFLLNLRNKGLTQEDIANKTGLSQTLISKLMRGGACNVETLIKIAKAFNVSTDEVLGMKETEIKPKCNSIFEKISTSPRRM